MRDHAWLAALTAMAIIASACGDGETSTTTAISEETTMTQGPQQTVPWSHDCNPEDDWMCANILPGGSGPVLPPDDVQTPDGLEHFCDVHPGQALIVELDVDPAGFGFQPVDPVDLFLSLDAAGDELEEAQGVLSLWAEQGIGVYKLINDSDDLFARIDEVQVGGFVASPHYLLRPAPTWKYGPHSTVARLDPSFIWNDLQVTGPDEQGEGRLVVIDTGANGDLTTIGIITAEPESSVDARVIGHGVFAASIAKKFNPNLNVELYRAAFTDGTLNEASVTAAFERANAGSTDVVNLSLGTYPCGAEYEPLGLAIALSGTVVAASGNDGFDHVPEQLYPASHPDVIGVGAFDPAWDRANWSNPGEVYGPGEDVVGWYHDGVNGTLAVWSGTSFAAPYIAACIASGVCVYP